MPNPVVFPKSTLEKSTNTNALFKVSLGSSTAYVNLYLDGQHLNQTDVRLSLSYIHGESMFLVSMYWLFMSLLIPIALYRNLTGGIAVYLVQIVLTLYLYRRVVMFDNRNMMILLHDLFPESPLVKQKVADTTPFLFKPVPFEFMSSKPLARVAELIPDIYRFDLENHHCVLRQQAIDETQLNAVIHLKKEYGDKYRMSVIVSLEAHQTAENETIISGELYNVRKSETINFLGFICYFTIVVWLVSVRLDAAFFISSILLVLLLMQEVIYKFYKKNDINDLTDFIYQALA